jgi:hypothetical protein
VHPRIGHRHTLSAWQAGEEAFERPEVDVQIDAVLAEDAGVFRALLIQHEDKKTDHLADVSILNSGVWPIRLANSCYKRRSSESPSSVMATISTPRRQTL